MKLKKFIVHLPLFLLTVVGLGVCFSLLLVLSLTRPFNFYQMPLFSELTILGLFVYLSLWYWYSPQEKRTNIVLPVLCGAVTSLTILYVAILWIFMGHSARFMEIAVWMEQRFQANNETYIPLFTSIFDKAETTNVRSDIDQQYGSLLSSQGNREPSYFVRLKGDTLQKLFQSGNLKNEVINTRGELQVVQMLKGQRQPIEFPQYTCCGGDDFFPDLPFLRHLLPERRYLKDFPSELEIILLVKDENGKILGAKVLLHGD